MSRYFHNLVRIFMFAAVFIALVCGFCPGARAGEITWVRQLGTAGTDRGYGVSTDPGGYVYVAGGTDSSIDGQSSAGGADAFITKYDPNGTKLWTRQRGSTGNDTPTGIATDSSGNLFLAGSTGGSIDGQANAGTYDMFVMKYNSSGVWQWTRQFGSSVFEYPGSVSTDSGGNVYITGWTNGSIDGETNAGNFDMFVTKYNSSGVKQWTRQLGTTGDDKGYDVAADASGNVYVTGTAQGSIDGQTYLGFEDMFVTKYNTSGVKQWTRMLGSAATDDGNGVCTDSAGNVYITGRTSGSFDGQPLTGNEDMFLTKFNGSGVKQWSRQLGGTSGDYGNDVITDTNGNVYVTGQTFYTIDGQSSAGGGYDAFVTMYDPDGTKLWTRQFGSSGDDRGRSISSDSGDNIYVAGFTDGSIDGQPNAGGYDMYVAKLASDTTAPSSAVTFPADGSTVGGTSVTVTGTAFDNVSGSGIFGVELTFDDWTTVYSATDTSGGTWATWSYGWTLPAEGTYCLQSRATDKYLNVETPGGCVTVNVDKTPPTTTASLPGAPYGARMWVTLTCNDLGATVYYTTDGSTPTTSSTVYSGPVLVGSGIDYPDSGAVDLKFFAVDAIGNEEAVVTESYTITPPKWTRLVGTAGDENAYMVATDTAGNAISTGSTPGAIDGQPSAGGVDVFVTKYSVRGVKLWTRQFGSAGDDTSYGITTDSSDNIYVTGHTNSSIDGQPNAGGVDVFITKYDSDGVKQWTRQLGSTADDDGFEIAADTAGNVYVTGYASGSIDSQTYAGLTDMFVTKYNSSGVKQWTRMLGTSGYDRGYGVATNSVGSYVYVTGFTRYGIDGQISAGGYDMFVTRYDSSGTKLNTVQLGTSDIDYGEGVCVSASDYVYVTGFTGGAIDGQSSAGDRDMFVAKYSSSLTPLWTRQLGSAGADYGMDAIGDSSNGVYIVGYTNGSVDGQTSAGGVDAFITKYDTFGVKQWTRQYGSSLDDVSCGISADSYGGIYIGGYTAGSLDGETNAGGRDMFVMKVEADTTPPTTTASLAGSTYYVRMPVTLTCDDPAATVYYTTDGSTPTTSSSVYSGPVLVGEGVNFPDSAAIDLKFFAVDADGNEEPVVTETYTIIPPPWTRQMGSTVIDRGCDVSTDQGGNVYVTGYTGDSFDNQTSVGVDDMFVTKYDPTGTKLWTRQLGTSGVDQGLGVATDLSGNVYVAGYTEGSIDGQSSAGNGDIFLTKYDGSGVKQWTRQFGSTENDYCNDVSTDTNGNVYVAGYTYGSIDGQTNAGNTDLFVTKYDSNGTKLWTRLLGSAGGDAGEGINTDTAGNIYVTGYTHGSVDSQPFGGGTDMLLTKYNTDGDRLWTRLLGTGSYEKGQDICVDASGNAYVTGYTDGSAAGQPSMGGVDMFVTKYDSGGTNQWTYQYGSSLGDHGYGVSTDAAGNIYVAGDTFGSLGGQPNIGISDIFIMKFTSMMGPFPAIRQYGTTGYEYIWGLTVGSKGSVIVAGFTKGDLDGQMSAGGEDMFVMKAVEGDFAPPVSAITSPTDGEMISGTSFTVTGTASDVGLGVSLVEITFDGWSTVNTATDTSGGSWATWSYDATLAAGSTFTIQSRATDAVGNVETPGPGVTITIASLQYTNNVWSWGTNDSGQLGIGGTENKTRPVMVPGLSGATAVVGGGSHSLALMYDGTVRSWGDNSSGQLGRTGDTMSPAQVSGLTGIIALAAGENHSVALMGDGTVWTWGLNAYGQLGRSGSGSTPAQVGITDVVAIDANADMTLAVKSDGTVWSWGDSLYGQLGRSGSNSLPGQVSVLAGIEDVAAGAYNAAALKSDGTVWTWGLNVHGQLGNGTADYLNHATPSQVSSLSGITHIAAGDNHVMARKSDGTVWVWGNNGDGQLGLGSHNNDPNPVPVCIGTLSGVDGLAAGFSHSIAVMGDETLKTWGYIGYGQLGRDADVENYPDPLPVLNLGDIVKVSGGDWHTLALQVDNTPPVSAITDPSDGANIDVNSYLITGTASDGLSSGIDYVEISTDGGATWHAVTDTSGGKLTTWEYDWLIPSVGTYDIVTRAGDNAMNVETPGAGITVNVTGAPELPHMDWDPSVSSSGCVVCHESGTKTQGTFRGAGMSFREKPGFCMGCHNPSGLAHEQSLLGGRGHSVMVNVTGGGAVMPTYGNLVGAEDDNRMHANLVGGDKVACVTCHNSMGKSEGPGRVWEMTTTSDNLTYTMMGGGWPNNGYLVPKVYMDGSLWSGPTNVRDRKAYLVDPSGYVYDEAAGEITFNDPQDPAGYVYVTLEYPYLRVSNEANRMCSDCHPEATHQGLNCLTCHSAHNTGNESGIREDVRLANTSTAAVVFKDRTGTNSFADGDGTYDGICEICHTQTLYHMRDGSGAAHNGGTDCTSCHGHAGGFPR